MSGRPIRAPFVKKTRLLALRLTEAEVARLDAFLEQCDGALLLNRADVMRLALAVGLRDLATMDRAALAEIAVGAV